MIFGFLGVLIVSILFLVCVFGMIVISRRGWLLLGCIFLSLFMRLIWLMWCWW